VKNGNIYNGADDDGSGTVALLEITSTKSKKRRSWTKRSILFFIATGGHGLLGSQYYSENPLFTVANTIADINIDMIGHRDKECCTDTNNYVYLIGADRLSSDLNTICLRANEESTFKWAI
jgi:Zn-dependent M28 family amino/carboxypeptidase